MDTLNSTEQVTDVFKGITFKLKKKTYEKVATLR